MTDVEPLTDEQLRDAFLVGEHKPRLRTNDAEHLREAEGWRKRGLSDRPLSAKWYMVMTMQLRGLTNREIAARMHCGEMSISNIQKSEKYQRVLEARMGNLDQDILLLKPKAIGALTSALEDNNKDTALRAARTFFEMTGQGTFGKTGAANAGNGVGAVDLARALVAEARAEVHIHVETQSEVHGEPRMAGRASSSTEVRGLHEHPSGGLLGGSPADSPEHDLSREQGRPEPRRVEGDRGGAAQAEPRLDAVAARSPYLDPPRDRGVLRPTGAREGDRSSS